MYCAKNFLEITQQAGLSVKPGVVIFLECLQPLSKLRQPSARPPLLRATAADHKIPFLQAIQEAAAHTADKQPSCTPPNTYVDTYLHTTQSLICIVLCILLRTTAPGSYVFASLGSSTNCRQTHQLLTTAACSLQKPKDMSAPAESNRTLCICDSQQGQRTH